MRILFTGGGTGGHFYPIIAVADEVEKLVKEKRLIAPELYYMAPDPYSAGLLYEHNLTFIKNSAGKVRRYFSIQNFFDLFKTGWGTITSLFSVYRIYPDVVFGKGGYASFPALLAARILRIPVVIHESDSVPGRVNKWASKFAARIAVSYPEAAVFFDPKRVAVTGQPVRSDIANPISEGAHEFLHLEPNVPVVLILGGSQGAGVINDSVLEDLKSLVEKFQIIHQVGAKNLAEVKATAAAVLHGSTHADRYKPFDYLNPLALRMSAGVASVVVSRAGSTLFEIAAWQIPSIIIPINEAVSHDQHSNAFAFARAGVGEVIEEKNLSAHILKAELERLTANTVVRNQMIAAAKTFYKPDAAKLVAEEIVKIALSHELDFN
jgi:UDP-N-acetylglucosamine--N-acetylmuramyl-(pentapeptide) pyrophosphoryl-undecaprenol N-acetylglucosamine transferase